MTGQVSPLQQAKGPGFPQGGENQRTVVRQKRCIWEVREKALPFAEGSQAVISPFRASGFLQFPLGTGSRNTVIAGLVVLGKGSTFAPWTLLLDCSQNSPRFQPQETQKQPQVEDRS